MRRSAARGADRGRPAGRRPAWPLARLVELCATSGVGWISWSAGDLAVRASLDVSYQALDERGPTFLRLLGFSTCPISRPGSAAVVLGLPVDEAVEYAGDAGGRPAARSVRRRRCRAVRRYRFHDLVRLFARNGPQRRTTQQCSDRALNAWLRRLAGMAERMARTVPGPATPRSAGRRAATGRRVEPADGGSAASGRWFDTERAALLAGVAARPAPSAWTISRSTWPGAWRSTSTCGACIATGWSLNTEVLAVCRRTRQPARRGGHAARADRRDHLGHRRP